MRQLEFQTGHRCRIIVGIELGHILMRKYIPVVCCSHRDAGSLWRLAGSSFRNGVRDLPEIRRDLGLLPFAFVIIPFMAASDAHPCILGTVETFKSVVGGP